MAVWIGALVAANALLLALVLSVGQQLFVNHLAGTAFGPASRVFFDTLLAYLERGQEVVLWLGIIVVVAGLFAGANRYGTAVRTTVSGGLEKAGATRRRQRTRRGHRTAAGWPPTPHGCGWSPSRVGAVVLLWGNDVSLSRLWWSLALVLVLLAVPPGPGRSRAAQGATRLAASRHGSHVAETLTNIVVGMVVLVLDTGVTVAAVRIASRSSSRGFQRLRLRTFDSRCHRLTEAVS